MSAETVAERIQILKDYKLTTDVGAEVDAVNREIEELEENMSGGVGEGEVPSINRQLPA